jgi:hypothetical protein
MAVRESTQVGYRLRMQPADLSTFPDRIKMMWFQWVVDLGLARKDLELSRGWDKDGNIHPLAARTIKYRKSEVGPVTKNAPRLIPALELSRVRSLLTGRAHATSAEFWWKFDSVTGDSFAVILHYAAEAGHDVFGLSRQGTEYVQAEALRKWARWKAAGGAILGTVATQRGTHAAKSIRKAEVKRPLRKVEVKSPVKKVDLSRYDLTRGEKSLIEKAIAAGRFKGFSRTNLRGEQWKSEP